MKTLLACGLGILLIAGVAPAGEGKDDQAKLKGKWHAELEGKKIALEFTKDGFSIDFDGMMFKGTVKIDPKKKPKEMDMTIKEGADNKFKDKTALAIYEIDGDKLKWCASEPGKETRPKEFPDKEGGGGETLYLVFKRVK